MGFSPEFLFKMLFFIIAPLRKAVFNDYQPSHDNLEQGIIEDRYSDEPPDALQQSWDVLTDYLPAICPLIKTLLYN